MLCILLFHIQEEDKRSIEDGIKMDQEILFLDEFSICVPGLNHET